MSLRQDQVIKKHSDSIYILFFERETFIKEDVLQHICSYSLLKAVFRGINFKLRHFAACRHYGLQSIYHKTIPSSFCLFSKHSYNMIYVSTPNHILFINCLYNAFVTKLLSPEIFATYMTRNIFWKSEKNFRVGKFY